MNTSQRTNVPLTTQKPRMSTLTKAFVSLTTKLLMNTYDWSWLLLIG